MGWIEGISFSPHEFTLMTNERREFELLIQFASRYTPPDNILDYIRLEVPGRIGYDSDTAVYDTAFFDVVEGPKKGTVLVKMHPDELGAFNLVASPVRNVGAGIYGNLNIKGICLFRNLRKASDSDYDYEYELSVNPGAQFILHANGAEYPNNGAMLIDFTTDSQLIEKKEVSFIQNGDAKKEYVAFFTAGSTPGKATVVSTSSQDGMPRHKWVINIKKEGFVPVEDIKIAPSKIESLDAKKGAVIVNASIYPANATYKDIDWRVALGGHAYAEKLSPTSAKVTAFEAGYSRLIAEPTDGSKQSRWIPVYSQDETNDADKIEVSQQNANIEIGSTLHLDSVIIKDGTAKEVVKASDVSWSTSSAKIASVNTNGLVTGVSSGRATIRVEVKNNPTKYATCVVAVKGDEGSDDPTPSPTPTPSPDPTTQVEAVSISKTEINLNEGDSYELKAVVAVDGEMSVATDSDVYWKSQNARVAIVSSAGVVTAISAGSAIIRATSKKNSAISDTCTVRVSGAVTPSGDDSGSDEPEDVSPIVYPDSLDPETIAVSEAVSIVRKNLDEIGLNDSVMYSENTDNESLDKVIMMTLPEAINEVHLSAPIELLEGTDKKGGPFSSIYVADNVLHFSIANDFLRLVSFQAADSSIVLTDIIPEASPQGRKQLNKYIRGTYDRPFLIGIQGHRRERAFAYYTLKSTAYEKSPANAIKRFSYVERLFYNPLATSYPISSGLKHAVYNHLTGMVLAIYGENQRAEYFFNKAIKNIA